MSFDATNLLRRLEPAVRRGGPGPSVQPVPAIADAGFGDLLTMVATGRIRSDRAVEVASNAAIEPPLDEHQLQRLAAAADEAEMAGAHRAIMLMDGRGLVLDVASRRVENEVAADRGPLTGIDAAVAVPADDRAATADDAARPGAPSADGEATVAREPSIPRPGPPLGPPSARLVDVTRAIPSRGTPLAGDSAA